MANGVIKNSSPNIDIFGMVEVTASDLDDLKVGTYTRWLYATTPTNAPYGAGECYTFGNYFKHQIAFNYSDGNFKTRAKINGAWSAWI